MLVGDDGFLWMVMMADDADNDDADNDADDDDG